MTNIPLFCNVCPKDPEFSDVSHLLTHVASKGHLSQHNKAKLRAHQDASLGEKLQAYDHWYQRHQIERLLSERMIAKDSKDSSSRVRASRTIPRAKSSTKDAALRKRQARAAKQPQQGRSPVKHEAAIDPRLSRPDRAAGLSGCTPSSLMEPPLSETYLSQTQVSPTLVATSHGINLLNQPYNHYSTGAPVPRMSSWQGSGLPLKAVSIEASMESNENLPLAQNDDTDGESDYFHTFIRSPTRTAYPDPSEITAPRSGFSIGSSSFIVEEDDLDQSLDSKDVVSRMANTSPQSPVLRGVKWPGMSIFDSANQEAQRLRNQKKTEGIIEHMEQNAAMVEQLERIYWPDGSLKMQRVITGEVESSPIRELTPPPKPPKRRRAKVTRPVLTDLSTNVPKTKKPRSRKVPNRMPASQASELQNISHEALASLDTPRFVYPRNAHMGYNPPEDEELEQRLTSGLPMDRRHRGFSVFRDQEGNREEQTQKTQDYAFAQKSHGLQGSERADASGVNASMGPHSSNLPHAAPRLRIPSEINNISKQAPFPYVNENNENIEPILDGDGRVHVETPSFDPERITQRYFSVTGDHPPQFFNSMPPGMDFGGVFEPRYYGTTLNPLNAYLRQHHSAPSHAQTAPFSQAQGNFLPSASYGQGGADGVSRPRY